jgi:hypothetical protein
MMGVPVNRGVPVWMGVFVNKEYLSIEVLA